MDAFAGALLLFAVIFIGGAVALVTVVFWWNMRARKRARLEMKRHVQKMEIGSA